MSNETMVKFAGNPVIDEVSPLNSYALAGLRRCWMPDRGTWSHKYHLDGRAHPNETVPHSDVKDVPIRL